MIASFVSWLRRILMMIKKDIFLTPHSISPPEWKTQKNTSNGTKWTHLYSMPGNIAQHFYSLNDQLCSNQNLSFEFFSRQNDKIASFFPTSDLGKLDTLLYRCKLL